MKKKITRTKQCQKCPWKVSTNPHDIPNGYCEKKHKNLKGTIAEPGSFRTTLTNMACHETEGNEGDYCVGWLFNQLGTGNNIGLRFKMIGYDLSEVELDGEQHKTFEDTLPKKTRRGRT